MTKQSLWKEVTRVLSTMKSGVPGKLGFAIVLLLLGSCLADAASESLTFTPLHIYYISPTGNDSQPRHLSKQGMGQSASSRCLWRRDYCCRRELCVSILCIWADCLGRCL